MFPVYQKKLDTLMSDQSLFRNNLENPAKSGHALESHFEDLRETLRSKMPAQIAENTGVFYSEMGVGRGEFHFSILNSEIRITYPQLEALNAQGLPLPPLIQALVMYYFVTANGKPLTGAWVSFADLPDGRMYAHAFQGYSGDEIVKAYGLDIQAVEHACKREGGKKMQLTDLSYAFNGLPRIPLLVAYWQGDDEFPSSCHILFDSSAWNYLPIDACAIIGHMLAGKLIRPSR